MLGEYGASSGVAIAQDRAVPSNRAHGEVITFSSLKPLIDEVIASDALLGKQRIAIDARTKVMWINMKPVPLEFIGSPREPLTGIIEQAVRIEVIQRDLKTTLNDETFWQALIGQMEATIDVMLLQLHTVDPNYEVAPSPENLVIEKDIGTLHQSLLRYAAKEGLAISETREPAAGFSVTVKFEPFPVRVEVMPMLAYLLSKRLGTPLDDEWVDLKPGPEKMCGEYRYIANWPSNLNGRVEGTFEVMEDGDVVLFQPGGKK